jgi:putative transposase
MTRVARIVVPETPHHVTQRGNNRQDVFFTDGDREFYLECLREHSEQYGLEIMAYCLMTNHVHLLVIPRKEDSLARALGRTHYFHSRSINTLHGRSGHLWQNRFFSCPLDEGHYWAAARYLERNPVRAKMVKKAEQYAWSSARAHVTGKDRLGVLNLRDWPLSWTGSDWRQQLAAAEDEATLGRLRGGARSGRPLGTDSFISRLESLFNRRLRPPPLGRPRKQKGRSGAPRRRRRKSRRR